MPTVLAFNGSPRMEMGATEMILAAFLRGASRAGATVDTFYPSRLNIDPCDCGEIRCWYTHPGECYHRDQMDGIYPRLKEAEILVLATPVYTPLPGDMQHVINRLIPLMDPFVQLREGRTRARLREGVRIEKIVLVATGGWWETENFTVVTHIVRELAENMSVGFGGAVVRPHASMMKRDGLLTKEGEEVLLAVEQAGHDLITEGTMSPVTLERICAPLVSEEVYRRAINGEL